MSSSFTVRGAMETTFRSLDAGCAGFVLTSFLSRLSIRNRSFRGPLAQTGTEDLTQYLPDLPTVAAPAVTG